MTKKTLLTSEMITEIVRLYKLRFRWIDIAAFLGINRRTLHNWRRLGEKAETGIYRDLVLAIEKADDECRDGRAKKKIIKTRRVQSIINKFP